MARLESELAETALTTTGSGIDETGNDRKGSVKGKKEKKKKRATKEGVENENEKLLDSATNNTFGNESG